MSETALTPISYSIDDLLAEFKEKIKNTNEWADISTDDTIFDLFAKTLTYGMSYQLSVNNNTFVDFFPHLTMADEPLYWFANFLGVTINGARSCSGTVTFTLESALLNQVVIPDGTQISTQDGKIYKTISLAVINPGDLSTSIGVIQGTSFNKTYYGSGAGKQKYSIYIKEDSDPDNFIVTVDGNEWKQVDNFYSSNNTSKHYIKKYIKDGFYILFNDGLNGMIPPKGSEIIISAIETLGSSGNIYAAGSINKIIDEIYDSEDNSVTTLSVSNPSTMINGSDEDTINEIKSNITYYISSNPYLTRKNDYIAYLKANDIVLDCNAYAGWELFPDDNTKWMTIYFYVVTESMGNLSSDDKEVLNEYVKEKDIFFSKLNFNDALYVGNIVNISLQFNVYMSSTAINAVEEAVTNIVEDFYNIAKVIEDSTLAEEDRTAFRDINHSALLSKITTVDSKIRKANLVLQTNDNIHTVASGEILLSELSLKFTNMKNSGTYLYLGTELIGTFNASWVLVPATAWSGLISATINNTAKTITITLDPNLTNPLNSGNIIGRILYVRSDAVNGYDIEIITKNTVFLLDDINYTILT